MLQVADYAADPLCRGIFAGDCRQLSMKSCFPDVFNYEQTYGSVIKGALRAPRGRISDIHVTAYLYGSTVSMSI